MSTYLFVLLVRSDDAALLTQLVELGRSDAVDAELAASLLYRDGRIEILKGLHLQLRDDLDWTTALPGMELSIEDPGTVGVTMTLDDLPPLSFVVVHDAGPIAQFISSDTLLVSAAERLSPGEAPRMNGPLPESADTRRGRRRLLDQILLDNE